jgi:type I restriction enzyme, S subunit
MSSRSSASQANAPKGTQTVTSRRTPVVPAKAGTSKAEGSFSAQRLLKLYDRVADAPDAVDRLRKFVLDLAVRGKLVEQDPGDEPAGTLLERVEAKKDQLVTSGKIRKPKPISPLLEDDVAFPAPRGWTWVRLAEISACLDFMRRPINGAERKRRIQGKPKDELYPYYGATQQQGWIDDYIFDEELVLLGEDGVPFFDPFRSKAYIVRGKTWVNNHAHVFKGVLVSNQYLAHYLNVFDYSGRVVGATRAKLNQARALDIPVVLPPLAEQHRIVARVNHLMALLDRLETTRTRRETTRNRLTTASLTRLTAPETTEDDFPTHSRFALDNLDQLTSRPEQINVLRQTVLNLAVRGKLVEQDPADEPASELLTRAQNAMADLVSAGEVAKMKAIAPTSKKHHLFDAPFGWCWVRLGQISKLITKGSSPKWQGVQYVDEPHGVLFVTSENVGVYNLTKMDAPKYVEARFNTIESRSILMRGDLLLNLVGASIGRAAEYTLDVVANINQAVALIRPIEVDKYFINRFILHYLNSPTGVEEILGFRVTAAQPNISLTDTRNLLIPLPPLAEQLRIVEKVDTLMALCNRLEGALENTETPRAYLLENLLNKALSGDTRNIAETPEAHIASR